MPRPPSKSTQADIALAAAVTCLRRLSGPRLIWGGDEDRRQHVMCSTFRDQHVCQSQSQPTIKWNWRGSAQCLPNTFSPLPLLPPRPF